MKTSFIRMPLLACLFTCFTACVNKDLCYDHDAHALKYQVGLNADYQQEWEYTLDGGTDWSASWPDSFAVDYNSLRPATPSGLRALIYNTDGTNDMVNLPPSGGNILMSEGEHSLLFYNNDTEYIVFDNLETYALAKARTRTRTRSTYMGNEYLETQSENTVAPPDVLYGHYIKSYTPHKTLTPEELDVTMRPLVFTYLVRYEFSHGLQYVALARGALAGMAGSVFLNDGHTSSEQATLLYDCTLQPFGSQAIVNSFGIPDYPNGDYNTRADHKYGLNLEVRLKNGKLLTFDFDVTDQLAKQPHGGVIIVKDIEVSDEDGKGGSSGFDVDVDGWGDYEDIDLPL